MKKLQLGKEFFVSAFIAMLCCIFILLTFNQEENIDNACAAIESFDQESMQLYADEVWDVNGIGRRKETMLMVACRVGNKDAIEYLVLRGADTNYTVPGAPTPLELFCRTGYEGGEDALLLLLNSGLKQSRYTERPAIFNLAENFYWMTDEQKAIATEESILMLKAGAPMGYANTSLLHLAAKADMSELFYTIAHTTQGLSMLTMEDSEGFTPWETASRYGATKVQKIIRDLEKEWREEQEQNKPTEPINPIPTEPNQNTNSTDSTTPTDDFDLDAWLNGVG